MDELGGGLWARPKGFLDRLQDGAGIARLGKDGLDTKAIQQTQI
jgi:hypothetical protein